MTDAPDTAASPFTELLDAVASKAPAPGGGFVASAVGALGAALGRMVLAYSLGKKSLAEHEGHNAGADRRLAHTRDLLLRLATEDAAAYELVNELQRLPEDDARRRADLPGAAMAATQIPLAAAAACTDLLRICESLVPTTNRWLRSDLAIASVLAEAAARACRWNVAINLPLLDDLGVGEPVRERLLPDLDASLVDARQRLIRIEDACA
ncbi:MAG: cyclodeaminase/cyclohydrolase family protein [Phycisphaerales bacterium]